MVAEVATVGGFKFENFALVFWERDKLLNLYRVFLSFEKIRSMALGMPKKVT